MSNPNKSLKILSIILLAMSLGACVTAKPKPAVTMSEPVEHEQRKASILEYAANMLAASGDTQKKELSELTQNLSANRQDIDTRMKLGLLYGLPNSKVKDFNKAQALLDDLVREPSLGAERKLLGNLLRDYIADTAKLAQKARDEQKRSEGLQMKAETAQQKADNLQRKLDELKNIEKTMTDRGQGNN